MKDHYIPEITSIEHDGNLVEPPQSISWFPDQLAWQMTTPKNIVRRFPPFASFQKFLVSETSVGNISRQEVVSMIPPLLMDVKPGMAVLDLCAAPGSKAAQLIEMVHGGEEARTRNVLSRLKKEQGRGASPDDETMEEEMRQDEHSRDWSDSGRTTGLLIANDADYKRAHLLIHQMKRLDSPNLIVTNHDATIFPSIKLPSKPVLEGATPKGKYLKFDRILADVPCSGDGTCRKNFAVWQNWTPGNALGLFNTQVRILVRALQMLKVGGRVVYSTCSMNPVENEAVVASAIHRCGGLSKVDVVDCSNALPGLKTRGGLNKWKVIDRQGKIWQSWQEVEAQRATNGDDGLGRLAEGMFSPEDSENTIPFERCMRVYPHLQDTGAFFITVLEKKIEIKAQPENGGKKPEPEFQVQPRNTQLVSSTSILNAVAEIEAMPTNGTNPIEKIDALDSILPPHTIGDQGLSAAARQNKEVAPSQDITSQKRELDAEADAEMATKRLKTREEVDEPAPEGAEDRQVHWPPPPGALLELSRPSAIDSSPKHTLPPRTNLPQKVKTAQPFEEPFKYLSPDHPELQSIYDFYDLSPDFPRDRFMVRNALGSPVKTIYYTSKLAREILTENEGKGLKFVHCGIKMFVKQDVQKVGVCKWRIQTDGLPVLEGWVGERRVVRLRSRETLRKLLVEMFPKVTGDGWRSLGEIGERVRDVEMGCCVLRVEKGQGEDSFRHVPPPPSPSQMIPQTPEKPSQKLTSSTPNPKNSERLVLPLWRSLHSLNLMLPKEDRKAMLLRLYNDDSPFLDHSKDRFAADHSPPLHTTTAEAAHRSAPAARDPPAVDAAAPDSPNDGVVDDDDEDKDEEDGGVALGSGEGIMELGGGD